MSCFSISSLKCVCYETLDLSVGCTNELKHRMHLEKEEELNEECLAN